MTTFSYRQEIYDEVREPLRQFLRWRNKEKTWTYDNCDVDVIGMDKGRARVVVRRKYSKFSKFMGKRFEMKLMMGFVATGVRDLETSLEFDIEQNDDKHYGKIRDKHRELKDVTISGTKTEISELYKLVKEKTDNPPDAPHTFPCETLSNSDVLPVIYQPKVDAWNNFLREINVHKQSDNYEITLVFEGEELRKHRIFDILYKIFRWGWYRRTKDIESFTIDKDLKDFTFPGIYSGDDTLFDDSTHNDKDTPVVERKIKYYYQNDNHPIVFVNTSNHAMAPHDNNHDFWKLEYIPWAKDIPLKVGNKDRTTTEGSYKEF